jgi:hypothetical protein
MPETYRSDARALNAILKNINQGELLTEDDLPRVDSGSASNAHRVHWLRGLESPFGVDVFDCRAFSLHHEISIGDPELAESFLRNRYADGKEYVGLRPEHPIQVDVSYRFDPGRETLPNGALYKAERAEEKWDIYHYDGVIYFVRSWTGTLVHSAECHMENGELEITNIMTDAATLDERDVMFFIREVYYLIVSHILSAAYPHPLPTYLSCGDESIVDFSFSRYGKKGLFGVKNGPPFEEKNN